MRSGLPAVHDAEAARRVNSLGAAWAVNTLANSIVYPFIPLYLHEVRCMPMAQVGLIFPVMGIAAIVGPPLAGMLADRIGRRMLVIGGTFGEGIAFLVLAFLTWRNASFPMLCIWLFIRSLLGSSFQSASHAYVTDLIVSDDRVLAFGRLRVGLNVGWMFGPAIGSFLARSPFALLFILTGVLCLATAVICALFCPEDVAHSPTAASTHDDSPSFFSLIRENGHLTALLSLSLLLYLSVSQFVSTLSVYSTCVTGISKNLLGLLYMINGAMIIVLLLPINHLLRRTNLYGRIAAGAVLYAGSFLWFGAAGCWLDFACAIAVMTMGEILAMASITAAVSQMAAPAMVGRYMGALGLISGMGWALGPYLGSLAFERLKGTPMTLWAVLASGAVCAAAGFGLIAVRRTGRGCPCPSSAAAGP